jgi:GH15 family glucan-1,4-alpha-glucosidase
MSSLPRDQSRQPDIGEESPTKSTPMRANTGFDRDLHSFVQAYGSKRLDAGLLLIPLVGFLPHTDPRVRNMLRAIEERLLVGDEFVLRYRRGIEHVAYIPESALLAEY